MVRQQYQIQQCFFNGWDEAWPYDPADQIPPDRYKTKKAAQKAIDDFLEMCPDFGADEFRIVQVKIP
jgi:hypothetical protein